MRNFISTLIFVMTAGRVALHATHMRAMNTLPVTTTPTTKAASPIAVPKRSRFDRFAGIATTGALVVALLLALAVVVPVVTGPR